MTEDVRIKALRQSGLGWTEMRNAHFPSKTAKALRTRYESNPSLDPNGKRGPFTACEDSELLRLRQVEHLP